MPPAKMIISPKWDEYFPLINKAVLGLLFTGAIMIATGVDVVQLGGKLLGGGNGIQLSSDSGELVMNSLTSSAPATGLAAWHNTIVAVAMMLGVVVLALYILSVGGRDAERMKEQSASHKKEQSQLKPDGEQSAPVSDECNLATYKMFYAEPAANDKA